jgi:ferredoxin
MRVYIVSYCLYFVYSGNDVAMRVITVGRKLKIHVEQDKCQGHARCKSLAPELFELDEYGNAREIGDGSVPPGLEDKAWLAQSNCPEIAIEVSEE